MKPVKLILILIIVLLIPLIPFILWNQSIEESVVHWTTTCSNDPLLISGATIGLLTVDLFLPIPSSVLSVFVTRQLSTIISPSWLGMIISILVIWTGMTLGALSAWLVGKFGGEAIARRFAGEEQFTQIQEISNRHSAAILVILRAVPLFSEAAALAMACSGVHFWKKFFCPIALSNAGIALIYGLLGTTDNKLPLWAIIIASIALPATVSLIAKFILRSRG